MFFINKMTKTQNKKKKIAQENIVTSIYEVVLKEFTSNTDILKKVKPSTFKLKSFSNNYIHLYIESKLNYAYLNSVSVIKFIKEYLKKEYDIECQIDNENVDVGFQNNKTERIFDSFQKKIKSPNSKYKKDYEFASNLNNKQSFDNFIKARYNESCWNAAMSIIKDPGGIYNPLFIYGKSGVGKTHLLNAIGNKLLDNYNYLKILIYGAEDFCEAFVNTIFTGFQSAHEFKRKLYRYDVLLIDDIQMNAERDKTNEVFFQIFENFRSNDKQIVITSDTHPKKLKGFHDRLTTRFEGGLVTDFRKLDDESSKLILKSKIKTLFNNITFNETALNYIVKNFSDNVRSIEGALNRIRSEIDDTSEIKQIDKRLLENIFVSLITNYNVDKITLERIIEEVSKFYNINTKEIKSSSKKPNTVEARRTVIYFAKEFLALNNSELADYLNLKAHSSIITGLKKFHNQFKNNKKIQENIEIIQGKIKD